MNGEDDDMTKKMSNKKGSNFMSQRQFNKVEEDDTEGDTADEDMKVLMMNTDSLSYNMISFVLQDKVAIPRCGYFLIANHL